MNYQINDVFEMKKAHACGSNAMKIIRIGADIKIECVGCQHRIMLPRHEFNRKIKKQIHFN